MAWRPGRAAMLRLGTAALVALAGWALPAFWLRERVIAGRPGEDARLRAGPSTIPGAGEGLFAVRRIAKGELIAEMGGRLVFAAQVRAPERGYLLAVPPCGRSDAWPFDALDGTEHGGLGRKINFAPRLINGHETKLQNTVGYATCHRPYQAYVAMRDIEPGEELLTSYGATYDYDFMELSAVQRHFCAVTGIDCAPGCRWEP